MDVERPALSANRIPLPVLQNPIVNVPFLLASPIEEPDADGVVEA
jgi:hypothetical protein